MTRPERCPPPQGAPSKGRWPRWQSRLPRPRDPVPPEILGLKPEESVKLDEDRFAKNIRIARRGAAPGPSGMTSEHLFLLLESDRTLASVCQVAGFLARAEVPLSILSALRLGRMTALRKPSGGVKGIVVSDVFRRFVARTIAQQFAKKARQPPPRSSTHSVHGPVARVCVPRSADVDRSG